MRGSLSVTLIVAAASGVLPRLESPARRRSQYSSLAGALSPALSPPRSPGLSPSFTSAPQSLPLGISRAFPTPIAQTRLTFSPLASNCEEPVRPLVFPEAPTQTPKDPRDPLPQGGRAAERVQLRLHCAKRGRGCEI